MMRPETSRTIATLACAWLLGGNPLAAQVVRGRLMDDQSTQPVRAALVALEDELGSERVVGLTDELGRFALAPAAAGRYVLRVERVGLETIWSPPFPLAGDETKDFQIPLPADSVHLRGLVPPGLSTACRPDGLMSPAGAIVWGEVAKILRAMTLADSAGVYRYEVVEAMTTGMGDADSAMLAQAPRRWLDVHPLSASDRRWVAEGFVRTSAGTRVYQPPTPAILLARLFQAGHCYGLDGGAGADSGLIGLRFESLTTDLADVEGTLWIDETTAAVRRLDYQYTNLTGDTVTGPRGRLTFGRHEDGSWLIQRWELRIPNELSPDSASTVMIGMITTAVATLGDVESGSTLVTGFVYDSTRGLPLEGARVFVWGTEIQTVTDARGRFSFGGAVPVGDHAVSFFHPRAAEWDYIPEQVTVSVREGRETSLYLAIPSLASLVSAACDTDRSGVVVGQIRDSVSGMPLPGAEVRLEWRVDDQGKMRKRKTTVWADRRGWYRACDLPAGVGVALRSELAGTKTDWLETTTLPDGPTIHHFTLPYVDPIDIRGKVTRGADTDEPVEGATVTLVGTETTVSTDGAGDFRFERVPPGFYELAVVHTTLGAISDTVTAGPDGVDEFTIRFPDALAPVESVRLQTAGREDDDRIRLEPITVEGEAVDPLMAGFYQRRSQGFGGFATRAEFGRWDPREVTDIIRRMPGFVVRRNPNFGNPRSDGTIDGREHRIEVTSRGRRRNFECPVLIFLDGALLGDSQIVDVNVLSSDMIQAIETYSTPAQVPAEFNKLGSDCGVIALWTTP